jgi:hypothetical protein
MLDALDDRQRKFEWPVDQGPEEFREVLADVQRPVGPHFSCRLPPAGQNPGLGVNLMPTWLEELLASVPPILEESLEDDPDSRHFVFERDDLGEILGGIEWWASEDDPWQGQCAEALAWLNETAGLDFSDLQSRWKDLPKIIVAKHLSDKYPLNEPRGLFGYLDQIRLAYIVGADLAAIALCRSTTELLIRHHYARHVPYSTVSKGRGRTSLTGTNPPGLIEEAEKKHELIGIGGHLAMPPLPHHRAYGVRTRRFDWVKPGQRH